MGSLACIEEQNLSLAWAHAVEVVAQPGRKEVAPLLVSVTGFDEEGAFEEDPVVRAKLDSLLTSSGKQSVSTVANTIFPASLWNPAAGRKALFDRYARILPRLRKASAKNYRGLYFERMTTGGADGKENQLDFAITTYLGRPGVRRSVLYVGVFDPTRDHSRSALLGFPCLQHVSFAPTDQGLCVNAFYAVQYMVERAYGNYVGLCRLGSFVARELEIPLARMTCVSGIAQLDVSKRAVSEVLAVVKKVDGN